MSEEQKEKPQGPELEVEPSRQRKATEKGLMYNLDLKEKDLKSKCRKLIALERDIDCDIAERGSNESIRVKYRDWMVIYEDFLRVQNEYLLLTDQTESTEYIDQLQTHDVHFKTYKMKVDNLMIQRSGLALDKTMKDQVSKKPKSVAKASSLALSVTSAKLKEEQKTAELKAKAELLLKKHSLELKKLQIKLEGEKLEIDTELAVSDARKKVLDLYDDSDNDSESLDEAVEQSEHERYVLDSGRPLHLDPEAVSFVPLNNEDVSDPGRVLAGAPRFTTEDVLMTVVKQLKKPNPEIKSFSGDPLHFRQFMRQFQTKVVNNTDSNDEKMNYLEQFTDGEANKVIRGYSYLDADKGYPAALKELEHRYGDEETIASAFVKRALNWPDVKADSSKALDDFAIFISECENAVRCIDAVKVLEYPDNIKRLVMKLPFYFHDKWRNVVQHVRGKNRSVTFHDLAEFIRIEARKANHPMYGREAMQKGPRPILSGKVQTKKSTTFSGAKGTFATSMTDTKPSGQNNQSCSPSPMAESQKGKVTCLFCSEHHHLSRCDKFIDIPLEDRLAFLKTKGLCFRCFRQGHLSRDCKFQVTCSKCRGKHQRVLHNDAFQPKYGHSNHNALSACVDNSTPGMGASNGDCAMAIIPVKVKFKGGNTLIETYAFLDPGSSISFCTEDILKKLGATGKKMKITLDTMGVPHTMYTSCVGGLEVWDMDMNNSILLPKMYSKDRMPVSPHHIPRQLDVDKWSHLEGIHLPTTEADIGLLIGNNVPDAYTPIELRTGPRGTPHASKSLLGWIIWNLVRYGENSIARDSVNSADVLAIENAEHLNRVEQMLKESFSLDFPERITDSKKEQSQEDKRFLKKVNDSIHLNDGHYHINLPFRREDVKMPDNRGQALQRLESLKRKLMRNSKFADDYQSFMSSILDNGFAEIVPKNEIERCDGRVWYIPHHGIYHPRKPGKIRVVFDCTSSHEGVSLNNQLLQGPDLTNNLLGILLRFRQERIAVMGDINQMFYQVKVPKEDTDFLRFFWWPGGNTSTDPEEYRMLVHLFGAVSSPSCSNAALRQTAIDNQHDFETVITESLKRNFYVDDFLSSVPSEQEALYLVQGISDMCQKGGFHLSKWTSNSHDVLKCVPVDDRAKNIKNLDLSCEDLPCERALGVYWSVETDKFGFDIHLKDKASTRRGVLSVVSSVYDPFGFASPFTLIAKLLQQDLCRNQVGWDVNISDHYMQRWSQWLSELPRLQDIQVDRCFKPPEFGIVARTELHMFSDASEIGYGVVAYLRLINEDGQIHCSLLIAKSRVAPIKKLTIPRMELTAATLSVKLCKQIINELDYPFDEIVYWTDSMAVIRYIANESSRFLTFVANRVSVIRDGSDTTQWKYVNSKDNPADAASRGLTMDNFLKASYWFHGPSFLWNAIEDDSEPENRSLDIDIDDVELKKPVHVTLLNSSQEQSPTERFLSYFSDWHKLKKAVAFILIWKAHLRRKASKAEATLQNQSCDDDRKRRFLSVDDLVSAEVAIIRYLQSTYFRDELKSLEDGGAITRSSSVYKLDPILVDGLLRVGGRLDRSELPFDSKHQILVPKNTHVTNLILAEIHRMVGHMGKNSMLSMLRQQFWIPGAGSLIKGVTSKCVICQRYKAKPGNQKMADLPSIRLTADEPPFTRTGVDYFGPFYVKRGRSDVKRYGVIFTCLAMRAVHLEVAQSMNTDSCINAIRRFLARRGPVKVIVSDNGSNLVGANRELRAEIKRWNNSKIHETLLQRNIDWQFNPPGGSHFGGVWERLIRSVRSVLLCVLKGQAIHLDDESLCTLFCEVEDVLNSRPITEVQNEPNDLSPLTPNHLLKIRSCQPLPPGIFQRDDSYVKRKWRQIQYLADLFWRRWSKEYLSSLQERQKWNRPKQNLRIGDLVILVDNAPRNSWPLGRVTELFKDKKGYVRTVKVRTQLTELVRPIDKLCVVMENQP